MVDVDWDAQRRLQTSGRLKTHLTLTANNPKSCCDLAFGTRNKHHDRTPASSSAGLVFLGSRTASWRLSSLSCTRWKARPCPCRASRRGSLAPGPTHDEGSRPWYVEKQKGFSLLSASVVLVPQAWIRRSRIIAVLHDASRAPPPPPLLKSTTARSSANKQLFQMIGPAQASLLHCAGPSRPARQRLRTEGWPAGL
jgi:hypothetical protein